MHRVVVVGAAALLLAGCAGSGGAHPAATAPEAAVLGVGDLPRGYTENDDTGCGLVGSTEGRDPRLDALFRLDRPRACSVELRRVWAGGAGPRTVTSIAYVFGDAASATRAFAQRLGLVGYATTLSQKSATPQTLGDEAWLVRGNGLNEPAAAVVWRQDRIVAALVTEPADVPAALRLARLQERRIEGGPAQAPAPARTVELALDDHSLRLPVYWLGGTFDPPGPLPALTLQDAFATHGSGPGNDLQLDYESGPGGAAVVVHLALWRPDAWRASLRTRLGRLVWDSPCARRTRVTLADGAGDVYQGYAAPTPLSRPCPDRPPDTVVAHVRLPGVVVTVNMPLCYTCAEAEPSNPYDTRAGLDAVVRGLRLRSR